MSENDPGNKGNEEGDPFGFSEAFLDNPNPPEDHYPEKPENDSSEKVDKIEQKMAGHRRMVEAHRRRLAESEQWLDELPEEETEKRRIDFIKSTKEMFEREKADIEKEFKKSRYRNLDKYSKSLSYLNEVYLWEQAPCVIRNKDKREGWLNYIEKTSIYGISGIEMNAEECFESLALGGSVEDVCEIIKKHDIGGTNEAGATYSVIRLVMEYSDQGEEFAKHIGWSEIDWKNDSQEDCDKKVLEAMKKIGLENIERFDGYILKGSDDIVEEAERPDEPVEKIDDAEKERREKIKGNREKYESRKKSINDAWEVAWDTFSDISSEEGFLESDEYKAVRSMEKGAEDMLTQLRAKLYREQAPLIIQDEKKRELWLENIEEIIAEEKGEGERHGFGFTPIDHWDEKCMEELALGGDMSKVCGMLKECHEGDNDHRIGATYNVIRDIIKYADRGDEFADYIGYSSIDFENDSLEEKNRKIQGVAEKIGFDDVEEWYFNK